MFGRESRYQGPDRLGIRTRSAARGTCSFGVLGVPPDVCNSIFSHAPGLTTTAEAQVMETSKTKLGVNHPYILISINNLVLI
jgi:hypothetical protein